MKQEYILYLFLIVIIIITISICLSFLSGSTESFDGSLKWKKRNSCWSNLSSTNKNILKKYNISRTSGDDWTIFFPCNYVNINKEIRHIHPTDKDQKIFIISGANQLAGKQFIWQHIKSAYGDKATNIMPNTYVLHSNKDLERFSDEFSQDKLYILKKNIQQQKGLKITRTKKDIMGGSHEGYVITQELLQDPYLVSGRKINMRFYLLIICKNKKISGYVHKEGFIYYTKVPFVKNSLEIDPNVTTGYIDRTVYQNNPLTLSDFKNYLNSPKHSEKLSDAETKLREQSDSPTIIGDTVFNRIYILLELVVLSLKGHICKNKNISHNTTFQLFGVDISLNDKLFPHLMEINKGPDMSAKDKKDKAVKTKVSEDMFALLNLIPGDGAGTDFVKLT